MDRYTEDSKWNKVLFKAGNKLQLAEIEEVQSLLTAQNTKIFNYLYSYYFIVKGLTLYKIGQTSTDFIFQLEEGQIYIDYKGKGYFIDIKTTNLSLPKNQRNYINIIPIKTIQSGDSLPDSLTGGVLFGDLGYDREVLNYELKINEEGYPIAIVDIFNNIPIIYNYFLEDFIKSSDVFRISKIQREHLETRFYEERGNFLNTGLIPALKQDNKLYISPGIAYLQGRRLNVNYPSYILLNPNLFKAPDFRTHILLKKTGRIILNRSNEANSLELGVVLYSPSLKSYQVIPSNITAYGENRIRFFRNLNDKINASIQELVLSYQSLIKSSKENIQLKDLFIDSFSSLDYSDINNPLYNSNVDTINQKLELSYTSLSIKFDNLILVSSSNFSFISKNNSYLYLTPSFSESSLFIQRKASSTLFLSSNELREVEPFIYITPTSTNEDVVTIIVEGYGLNLQTNLEIKVNSKVIRDINLLEGTLVGNRLGTFNGKVDGSIKLRLNNISLLLGDNLIEVTNENVLVTNIIKLENTTDIAATRNSQDVFNLGARTLCQYLNITTPITVSSFGLAIKDFNFLNSNNKDNINNNISAALVFLVSIKNDLPSEEIITKGNLYLNDIRKSTNGSVLSSVQFDKPAYLNKGLYGLVIYPIIPELEIFQYKVNERLINSSITEANTNTINNGLGKLENGRWKTLNSNLTFELKRALPITNISSAIFKIDTGVFNYSKLQSFISLNTPPTSNISLSYKVLNNEPWKPFNSDLDLQINTNSSYLKIDTENNNNRLPIINASESIFILKNYNKLGTWISKTVEFEEDYINIEVTFNYYLPLGSSIEVFFSSNEGKTWEKISNNFNWREVEDLIDNNIPLYNANIKRLNLSPIIQTIGQNGLQQNSLRKKLTLRLDFKTNSAISPYIQKLTTSVW